MSPPTLPRPGFRAAVALSLLFSPFLNAQNDPATPPPATISGSLYLDAWQLEKEFVVSPLALQERSQQSRPTLCVVQGEAGIQARPHSASAKMACVCVCVTS